jgi:hypothetical protein
MGWIQLVRSTDNGSGGDGFEVDPYQPLGRLSHPFLVRLRADTIRRSLASDARCARVDGPQLPLLRRRRARGALLGFAWGFSVDDEQVAIRAATPLAAAEWDQHLRLLQTEHPDWRFSPSYHDG